MTADGIDLPAGGRFQGRTHLFPLRVYFEDTDLSGVVYHANYLRFMERARSDMLRVAGIDQRAAFDAGDGAYAIADLQIRYHAPARLDDALVVASEVRHVTPARVVIQQSVRRASVLLTAARVTAALVGPDGRPRRQPRAWVDRYRQLVIEGEDALNPALATDPATLSPIALFLQADWVVKAVMLGLLAASIWTWAIIVMFRVKLARIRKANERFEADFWRADDIDAFYKVQGKADLPSARVLAAAVAEWRRSTHGSTIDRDGTRERLATAMGSAVAKEIDELSDRLNVLATVGSVAPFVGLFGTVWGIMRSFTSIASAQNTSLAVVAPGIAEALFATAIGLFAAIPAVIAYNRFGHAINRIEARLNRFADGFHATLSRQLDAER